MVERITGPLEDERRRRGRAAGIRPISKRQPRKRERGWSGTLSQRVRVTKRLPQAVVKITSHNRGRRHVGARLHYISRDGELSLETDQGLTLEGREEIEEYLEAWAADFSTRNNSRDAMSMVVSLPPGTDQQASLKSARDFFQEAFAENHEYAFAGHNDKDHFHVHVVVKMRGHDGHQLVTDKKDLRRWREVFAERARAHGIEMDASPRYARGRGRRATKGVVHQIRERAEREGTDPPRVDREAAAATVKQIRAKKRSVSPFEKKALATNQRERLSYAEQAAVVAHQAKAIKDEDRRLRALEMASELAAFAKDMPRPKSRNEVLRESLGIEDRVVRAPGLSKAQKHIDVAVTTVRSQLRHFAGEGVQARVTAIESRLSSVAGRRARGREEPDRSR